jgi:fatty acid desaturase
VHIIGYLAAVCLVLSPVRAIAFVLVQQSLFGVYLGCSFAPNHKGMPMLGEDEKLDFLRRQVITSRDIRGNWLVDFALGGLNYQIEHHLFPSMPRPSLRHAKEPVRAFCAQHGIAYREADFYASYAEVLRHLHTVGGGLYPELEY